MLNSAGRGSTSTPNPRSRRWRVRLGTHSSTKTRLVTPSFTHRRLVSASVPRTVPVGYQCLQSLTPDDPLSKDDPLGDIHKKMDELAQTVDLTDPSRTPDAADLDALSMYSWYRAQGASAEEIGLFLDPMMNALVGVNASEISFLAQLAAVKICDGWANMIANNARGAQYQRTRNGIRAWQSSSSPSWLLAPCSCRVLCRRSSAPPQASRSPRPMVAYLHHQLSCSARVQ